MNHFVAFIGSLVACPLSAQGASSLPPRALLDSAFRIVRENALHRRRVNWVRLGERFDSALKVSATARAQGAAFELLFEALDDVHSNVTIDGTAFGFYHGVTPEESARIQPLLSRARAEGGMVQATVLPGEIAYLRLPSYQLSDQAGIDSATAGVRRVVCRLGESQPQGWIIDLRVNTGGNVYPMLSGLGELLGDGTALWAVTAEGERLFPWAIRDGVLFLAEYRTATIAPHCPGVRQHRPIAVLLGPITASSGQVTAIAFAGASGVRTFGSMTAPGYATNNRFHWLAPNLMLNLAETEFTDRIGRRYLGVVAPDEVVVGGWNLEQLGADPVVGAAVAWIRPR